MRSFYRRIFLIFAFPVIVFYFYGCAGLAASAQEYYSIGMAYYELGKYDEAEKWLNRAKQADRTMTASLYNLGRIAFETKKYADAAKHFEDILKIDPNNVLALKAAAYSRIKTGDLRIAEKHYGRLLELVPESVDDGYNHALVLYAMERYSEAEETLKRFPFTFEENSETLLLYARSQKAQEKEEAMDSYAKWLSSNTDPKVRYEYAQILEFHEFYARAIEEYRKVLGETSAGSLTDPKRGDLRFALARVLLVADGGSSEGITEMETAVTEGFDNIEAVEELQRKTTISSANRTSLRNIINNMQRIAEAGGTAAQEQQMEQAELQK